MGCATVHIWRAEDNWRDLTVISTTWVLGMELGVVGFTASDYFSVPAQE